ncbi:MAG: hypothetical protein U1A06_06700 [Hoeflea sp.]|nr:hypothetical protein [Hoeflea sp.]
MPVNGRANARTGSAPAGRANAHRFCGALKESEWLDGRLARETIVNAVAQSRSPEIQLAEVKSRLNPRLVIARPAN